MWIFIIVSVCLVTYMCPVLSVCLSVSLTITIVNKELKLKVDSPSVLCLTQQKSITLRNLTVQNWVVCIQQSAGPVSKVPGQQAEVSEIPGHRVLFLFHKSGQAKGISQWHIEGQSLSDLLGSALHSPCSQAEGCPASVEQNAHVVEGVVVKFYRNSQSQ